MPLQALELAFALYIRTAPAIQLSNAFTQFHRSITSPPSRHLERSAAKSKGKEEPSP